MVEVSILLTDNWCLGNSKQEKNTKKTINK
jgi:hypothetical protein